MTVSSTAARVSYAGNGSTTAFSVPFRWLSDGDLTVYLIDSDGNPTTQTITTHYTLTGTGDDAGGTLTMVTAPASGEMLTIVRDPDIEQEVDYQSNDSFPAETHEEALDRLTMIAQRLDDRIGRTLRFPDGDPVASTSLELDVQSARLGKFLYFDATNGAPEMATFDGNGTVLSGSVVGALLYPQTSAESAAGATITDYKRWPGDVRRYGAVLDGSTDDSAAFNAASAQFAQDGGADIYIPHGYTTMLSSQWTVDRPDYRNCAIYAYGAELKTTGAISALKITGGAQPHACTVYGLKINHRNNATATAGIHISGSSHVTLVDPTIEGDDNSASYGAILVENGTASDTATGSFWPRIIRPRVRVRSGADGTAPTHGIILRGASNAAVIRDGSINAVTGIKLEPHSGQTYVSNGVVIDGCAFEGFTDAIRCDGDTTSTFSGLRITNCRAESGTNFLKLTGSTTQPAVPVWMSGNYLISSVTNYIVNTNSLYVNNFDFSVTPDFAQNNVLRSRDGLEIVPISGSGGDALTLWSSGAGSGVALKNNSGTAVARIMWGTATPESAVTAPVGSLFLRTDGGANTTLYVKESGTGNTGWIAK